MLTSTHVVLDLEVEGAATTISAAAPAAFFASVTAHVKLRNL